MSREARYADALAFLKDGGARFAEIAPRSAALLAEASQDPDVERILEGLAFLTSKIEAHHAEELPLLVDAAFDLFFPGFLAPIPAIALAEIGAPQDTHVPRGTELWSVPVEGTRCRFRTVFDMEASPLKISDATIERKHGSMQLVLRFDEAAFAPGSTADRIRLHLGGDFGTATLLYGWLTQRVRSVEWLDRRGETKGRAPEVHIKSAGLDPEESLFPEPFGDSSMALLKEYFAYPQKLLFVDILGARAAATRLGLDQSGFGLRLELATDSVRAVPLSTEDFRLGLTPVVNVFPDSAAPVMRSPLESSLVVRPDGTMGHFDVFAVREVRAIGPDYVHEYPLFQEIDVDDFSEVTRVAQVYRAEPRLGSRLRLHLESKAPVLEREAISIELWATNHRLPRLLRQGDINHLVGPTDRSLRARNVTGVAGPFDPPRGEAARRALIAALSLSLRPLATLESLRSALQISHFPSLQSDSGQRELDLLLRAIVDVGSQSRTISYRGDSALAREVTVTVDEQAFGSEGELHLLGAVLDRVFAMEAGLNTISILAVVEQKSRKVIRWPRRLGMRTLEP